MPYILHQHQVVPCVGAAADHAARSRRALQANYTRILLAEWKAHLEADVFSLAVTVQPQHQMGAALGFLLQVLADMGLHRMLHTERQSTLVLGTQQMIPAAE